MSQFIDGNYRTFAAGAAIEQHALVKLSSGKLAAAGLGEAFIGTLDQQSFADLDVVRVRLRTAAGTHKVVASGAFAAGALVYGRAAGRVDDISTTSAVLVGTALEAATTAGDIVEVVPSF